MKVALNHYMGKTAIVRDIPNIPMAGWIGFLFARDNLDLVAQGWQLYYYGCGEGEGQDNPNALSEWVEFDDQYPFVSDLIRNLIANQ